MTLSQAGIAMFVGMCILVGVGFRYAMAAFPELVDDEFPAA